MELPATHYAQSPDGQIAWQVMGEGPIDLLYVAGQVALMPAFTAKVLPDEELADIYAYLKSLPTAVAAKDIPALSSVREK